MTIAHTYQETGRGGERVRILELSIDRVDMAEVFQRVENHIRDGRPGHIVTVNIRFLSMAMRDHQFADIINGADLAVTDGMPLIWLSRLLKAPVPQRITGCDLIYSFSRLAAEKGYSIFILGGQPGVAEEAARRLCQMNPGLKVAGTHHGYFSEAEEPAVVELIRQSRPQFLFVGLGSPKQDFWINRWKRELSVPVSIGIGGTLDVVTGRLKRAPVWMQRASLEWFYRLKQEPRRLWRRYILEDVPTTLRAAGYVFVQAVATRVRPR